MKIEAGHPVYGPVTPINNDIIRFMVDGRCMFEVVPGKDGKSIEVRAVEMTKHGDKLYEARLAIKPNVSNSVTIETYEYEGGKRDPQNTDRRAR